MAIATYKTTTFKSLLANLKLELRLDSTTAEDIYLKRYLLICAKAMQTALDYEEKTFTLEICDYMAQLPCEFVAFDRPNPIVFTTNGQVPNSGYYNFFNVINTGGAFLECSPFNPQQAQWGVPTVQVQNGYLLFSPNIGATECTISALCVRVDETGLPIIPELSSRPIVAGAAFMYNRSIGKPYADFQREWFLGKRDVTGQSNLPDSIQNVNISHIWNSFLMPYPNAW